MDPDVADRKGVTDKDTAAAKAQRVQSLDTQSQEVRGL